MKQNELINKTSKIITSGDGTKYFSDNATYNSISIGNASKINNIQVDDSMRKNGSIITYNQTTNKYENAQINISGIIGNTGNITNVGNMITIESGEEKTFIHPTSSDNNIMINVQEQIAGTNTTDTHCDFSDSNNYELQDNGKVLIYNNKAELDIYTKLLMNNIENTFKDEIGHTLLS